MYTFSDYIDRDNNDLLQYIYDRNLSCKGEARKMRGAAAKLRKAFPAHQTLASHATCRDLCRRYTLPLESTLQEKSILLEAEAATQELNKIIEHALQTCGPVVNAYQNWIENPSIETYQPNWLERTIINEAKKLDIDNNFPVIACKNHVDGVLQAIREKATQTYTNSSFSKKYNINFIRHALEATVGCIKQSQEYTLERDKERDYADRQYAQRLKREEVEEQRRMTRAEERKADARHREATELKKQNKLKKEKIQKGVKALDQIKPKLQALKSKCHAYSPSEMKQKLQAILDLFPNHCGASSFFAFIFGY
jgi:hypothetical protein